MSAVLAACGHSAPRAAAPAAPVDAAAQERATAEAHVAWIEGKIEAMCACPTPVCSLRIVDELSEWLSAHLGDARIDEPQRERVRTGTERLVACIVRSSESSEPAP